LNRRPGIVRHKNDELRRLIAAAIATCINQLKRFNGIHNAKHDAVALFINITHRLSCGEI
jgi:hypothetical protein